MIRSGKSVIESFLARLTPGSVPVLSFLPSSLASALDQSVRFVPSSHPSSCCVADEVSDSDQVEGCKREGKHPAASSEPLVTRLSHHPDGLCPTEDLFHFLSYPLADGVAIVACRAFVDGARSVLVVLRDMWRDLHPLK